MTLRSLLYPRLTWREFRHALRWACAMALIAGVYGVLHDELTYTIAPEYFTKLKFQQFAYADWGFPVRVLVGEIGFLATWWVGFFAGWFLARRALLADGRDGPGGPCRPILVILVAALAGGGVGFGAGWLCVRYDLTGLWDEVINERRIVDTASFTMVACIHLGGYAGGALGWFRVLRTKNLPVA